MAIWDLFVQFDEQDVWVVLYLLKDLGNSTGAKSKYIAKIVQKPYREVVARLTKLEKLGLIKKQQTDKSLYAGCYPTHWWFISEEGENLIDSRKALDAKGHFQTTQRLNKLIPAQS
jgi:predicted transcriptional regulator